MHTELIRIYLNQIITYITEVCIVLGGGDAVNTNDVKQSTRIVGGVPAKLGEFKAQVCYIKLFKLIESVYYT